METRRRLQQTLARERAIREKAAMKFREGTFFALLGKDVTNIILNKVLKLCSICEKKYEDIEGECKWCHEPICSQCIPDAYTIPWHMKCLTTFCAKCCFCREYFRKNDMYRVSMITRRQDGSVARVHRPTWTERGHEICIRQHAYHVWHFSLFPREGCRHSMKTSYRNIIFDGDDVTRNPQNERLITADEYDEFLLKGKTCPLIRSLDGSAGSHKP